MGHGYFCVVAYGIIVPIEEFVEKFPQTFTVEKTEYDPYQRKYKSYYRPDYIKMEGLEKEFDISLHYEQENSPDTIFVCCSSPAIEDARCGGYQELNLSILSNEKDSLEKFANDKFPDKRISLKMYAYQGS